MPSPGLITATRRHVRALTEASERLDAALARRTEAQRAFLSATHADAREAFVRAVFDCDRCEADRRKAAIDYADARAAALPALLAFFIAWASEVGVSLDGEDVEGDLRASLRLIKGGR